MPCSTTTPRPIRSSPAPQLARRRRGTTPSAGSRATREPRQETTFSRTTGSGEPGKSNWHTSEGTVPERCISAESVPALPRTANVELTRRRFLEPRTFLLAPGGQDCVGDSSYDISYL